MVIYSNKLPIYIGIKTFIYSKAADKTNIVLSAALLFCDEFSAKKFTKRYTNIKFSKTVWHIHFTGTNK